MTRSDVVKSLANEAGITQPQAERVVNALLGIIELSLVCGEEVKLAGFGKFEVRYHDPVKRSNPRTGEVVDVPAKKSLGFKPSLILKGRLNQ